MMPYSNLLVFAPELWLCGLGLLVLIVDLIVSRRNAWLTPTVAGAGLLLCLWPIMSLWGGPPVTEFSGAYAVDGLSLLFKLLFVATGFLVILLSVSYFRVSEAYGEYFALVVFLVLGMSLLAGANDLIVIYLAFELVSITSYLLAAWRKGDRGSNEAGIKYLIYGAAASAVMLYGLTLIYGAGGSTNLQALSDNLMRPMPGASLALPAVLGVVLMAVGFGYKISMVPFHAWAPDVYQGAPTPVTALLSVGPKAAGFAVLMRVFFELSPALHVPWQMVFAVLATITMFTGNLLAIRQTNIKRMLAYSSIAHAGYLLIGFVVGPHEVWGITGIMVYLTAYLLMNLGMFGLAIIVEQASGSSDISRFAGLARSAPGYAAMGVILLLSLTGVPPTAGFLGKLYIFAAAINSREWAWLAIIGIINSVISLYYYMNVARAMYFEKGEGLVLERPALSLAVVVVVAAVGTVLLLAFPGWLIEAARMVATVR